MTMLKKIISVLIFLTLISSTCFSATLFDVTGDYPAEQAQRDDLKIGEEIKDGVFKVDKRPTEVSEKDKEWMKMTLKPGYTYLRNTSVQIKGKGYSQNFFLDSIFNVHWLAEVAWTSHILYNDGTQVVELRSYMPNNKISLLKSEVEIKCTKCLDAGKAIKDYAQKWEVADGNRTIMNGVKNAFSEVLDWTGSQFRKAQKVIRNEKAVKFIENKEKNLKFLFRESLFSDKWYLIHYNLNSRGADQILRVNISGGRVILWSSVQASQTSQEEEDLRRQTLVRSAYLMDAGVLPPDGKIDKIGETWTVPAHVFGQVVGNDVASDLDKINGSIHLVRDQDLQVDGHQVINISQTGSSLQNEIRFEYLPQQKGRATINQGLIIYPESLNIFFDRDDNFVRSVKLRGKADINRQEDISLWPDVDLRVEPYTESRYKAKIMNRNYRETQLTQDAYDALVDLVQIKFGLNLREQTTASD